ncbi:hypothetical protein DFP72DRAFT_915789 [Ephemerocybe angulata]|uniref:Uncharacterized protein n=1 Tax=Ephemerocybe angulata TaxID=980116 RepID=A0A8H6HKG4_9AGAR|nr:hypothetical protein DFP72DRAFT_915789 [Tulosesus angulatus]
MDSAKIKLRTFLKRSKKDESGDHERAEEDLYATLAGVGPRQGELTEISEDRMAAMESNSFAGVQGPGEVGDCPPSHPDPPYTGEERVASPSQPQSTSSTRTSFPSYTGAGGVRPPPVGSHDTQSGAHSRAGRNEREDIRKAREKGREELEADIRKLKAALSRKDKELGDVHARAADLEKTAARFQHELQDRQLREQRHAQEWQGRCDELERDLRKTKKLLASRTEELQVAQKFMKSADNFSVAEVSQMVQQLNDELYQCAMMISDAVIQERGKPHSNDELTVGYIEARQAAARYWGEDIISRLHSDVKRDEMVLFESMIQHHFTTWCREVITIIASGDEKMNDCLQSVWEGILETHSTPIAKNWLAMTNSQLQNHKPHYSSVVRDVKGLMQVAGWSEDGPGSANFMHAVNKKVAEITGRALNIRETVIEGILSTEVQITRPSRGTPYDPTKMQDAHDLGKSPKKSLDQQPIVCSTGLGVCCIVREEKPDGSKEVTRGSEAVLRAMVLLPSTLEP